MQVDASEWALGATRVSAATALCVLSLCECLYVCMYTCVCVDIDTMQSASYNFQEFVTLYSAETPRKAVMRVGSGRKVYLCYVVLVCTCMAAGLIDNDPRPKSP